MGGYFIGEYLWGIDSHGSATHLGMCVLLFGFSPICLALVYVSVTALVHTNCLVFTKLVTGSVSVVSGEVPTP